MIVLDAENQVLPDGIVETGAHSPAIIELCLAGEAPHNGSDGSVDRAPRPAALGVQQHPGSERPTDLSRRRIKRANLETVRYASNWFDVVMEIRPRRRTFSAKHKL